MGQMPVVIQFLFAGAFEAGVVSIVLMIKKINQFYIRSDFEDISSGIFPFISGKSQE